MEVTASELVLDNVSGTRLHKLVLCIINRCPNREICLSRLSYRKNALWHIFANLFSYNWEKFMSKSNEI